MKIRNTLGAFLAWEAVYQYYRHSAENASRYEDIRDAVKLAEVAGHRVMAPWDAEYAYTLLGTLRHGLEEAGYGPAAHVITLVDAAGRLHVKSTADCADWSKKAAKELHRLPDAFKPPFSLAEHLQTEHGSMYPAAYDTEGVQDDYFKAVVLSTQHHHQYDTEATGGGVKASVLGHSKEDNDE